MEEAIRIEHLKKYYGAVKAVDDISFTVEKGELFGFLGVNGAGKSTTINMLCTLQEPTEGKAWIHGLELGKENEKIKNHIGVVCQNNCLDRLLTVKENLLLRGSLYEKDSRKLQKNLKYVTEILDLADVLKRPFGKLSGGQKRRCEIARALMHTPDILFLDEPTTGLDPAARKNVWETVQTLQKKMNMTVFLTTHYMEEAAKADHIGIMDHGHFVEYGTPFSLKETYAKDKLVLIPKEGLEGTLRESLEKRKRNYWVQEERILVKIESTLSAIPLVEELQQAIDGFEVIQGTMDDVFLNVTGGKETEAEKSMYKEGEGK
ncbi:MAG: ABC transporter ATP-binding protein [Lachnospiraceae bacterium]|nr:ABC transporter ATP-binding protein [Lachnospiraceae bacterium]